VTDDPYNHDFDREEMIRFRLRHRLGIDYDGNVTSQHVGGHEVPVLGQRAACTFENEWPPDDHRREFAAFIEAMVPPPRRSEPFTVLPFQVTAYGDIYHHARFSWFIRDGGWPRLCISPGDRPRVLELPLPTWLAKRIDPAPHAKASSPLFAPRIARTDSPLTVDSWQSMVDALGRAPLFPMPLQPGSIIISRQGHERIAEIGYRAQIASKLLKRGPWWQTPIGWAFALYAAWRAFRER
jgi:hypothetical protein